MKNIVCHVRCYGVFNAIFCYQTLIERVKRGLLENVPVSTKILLPEKAFRRNRELVKHLITF